MRPNCNGEGMAGALEVGLHQTVGHHPLARRRPPRKTPGIPFERSRFPIAGTFGSSLISARCFVSGRYKFDNASRNNSGLLKLTVDAQ